MTSVKELHSYISSKVNVFIEPLVYDLVIARPDNPALFAIQWLQKYTSLQHANSFDDQEDQNDVVGNLELSLKMKKTYRHKSRIGISEEVIGIFNQKQQICIEEVPKSEQTQSLIKSLLRNSILFHTIDQKDEETLIQAMVLKTTEEHEIIIREGEPGNILYVVESGEYDCYKKVNGENQYVKTYQQGEPFGQLAFMYNAPWAASIVVKKAGSLLILDRVTFSHVLKVATLRKRELVRKVIAGIEIFQSIHNQEKEQLLDILMYANYSKGDYIIQQGEMGDKFYIVLEGTLEVQKRSEGQEFPKVVLKYQSGDYFGELALVSNVCRQASVRASNQVKVAHMSRQSFERVFGSNLTAFKQNQQRYYQQELETNHH